DRAPRSPLVAYTPLFRSAGDRGSGIFGDLVFGDLVFGDLVVDDLTSHDLTSHYVTCDDFTLHDFAGDDLAVGDRVSLVAEVQLERIAVGIDRCGVVDDQLQRLVDRKSTRL